MDFEGLNNSCPRSCGVGLAMVAHRNDNGNGRLPSSSPSFYTANLINVAHPWDVESLLRCFEGLALIIVKVLQRSAPKVLNIKGFST